MNAAPGCGVALHSGSKVTLRDVHVTGSEEHAYDHVEITADGLRIEDAGRIGALAVDRSRLTARKLTVRTSGNQGMFATTSSTMTVANCTITGNGGPGLVTARGATIRVEATTSRDNGAEDVIDIDPNGGQAVPAPASPSPAPAPQQAPAQDTGMQADTVETLLAELDAMVGLQQVKDEIRKLVKFLRVAGQRRAAGLPAGPAISRHLVFSGAPGTGKTTVARVYGRLLAALGAVPKGQFTEVSHADLVGKVLGETTQKTHAVFADVVGGVLFLDEAYILSRSFGSGSDFGQEAIDTLVKLMEDHRDEVIVIAAGHTDEMHGFMAANPGLTSRFSGTITFPSYRLDELLTILVAQAAASGFDLPPGTRDAVRAHLAANAAGYERGNAREIRKLFGALKTSHARRMAHLERAGTDPALDDLRLITAEDVP